MVKITDHGVFLKNGREFVVSDADPALARRQTMAYSILSAHNAAGDEKNLRLKFDALASHDITYVGILLTARAGGLESLPVHPFPASPLTLGKNERAVQQAPCFQ